MWSGGVPSDARRLDDLAGTQTAGAHLDVLGPSVHEGPDPLDVRKPPSFRQVMGVTDVVTGHRSLAANIASLRHGSFSFSGRPRRRGSE